MFFNRNNGTTITCNNIKYPLVCNNEEYATSLDSIRSILHQWVDSEIRVFLGDAALDMTHPVISLARVPVRSMPYNNFGGLTLLRNILNTVEYSGSNISNRFLDAIQLIQITIPIEIHLTIIGKFLYAMTQGIRTDSDGNKVGTLDDWGIILDEYPWVPYLPIYQSILFNIDNVSQLQNKYRHHAPTSITATG